MEFFNEPQSLPTWFLQEHHEQFMRVPSEAVGNYPSRHDEQSTVLDANRTSAPPMSGQGYCRVQIDNGFDGPEVEA